MSTQKFSLEKSPDEVDTEDKKLKEFNRKKRRCRACNKYFIPKVWTQIYCSSECSKKARGFYVRQKMREYRINKMRKTNPSLVKILEELASRQQFAEDIPIINHQKCIACGSTKRLVKHHISYNPEETVILCGSCHRFLHQVLLGKQRCRPKKNKK